MITAREIEKVTFSKPPIGKRGYNEDEVDAFLDLVGPDVAEYERIASDYDRLQDELERLRSQPPVSAPPPFMPPAPPPPVSEPPSAQAARILELAESTARTLTEESQREADRVIGEARSEANDITAEARYEAKKLLDGARQEVDTLTRQIAELRAFERNYRERLDVYIASQLDALRADGFIDPQS